MNALHRRLARLEAVGGQRTFAHLSDEQLDHRLREEMRMWLRSDPQACPADVRRNVADFLAAGSAEAES